MKTPPRPVVRQARPAARAPRVVAAKARAQAAARSAGSAGLVLWIVLLLALGGGGYWMMQRQGGETSTATVARPVAPKPVAAVVPMPQTAPQPSAAEVVPAPVTVDLAPKVRARVEAVRAIESARLPGDFTASAAALAAWLAAHPQHAEGATVERQAARWQAAAKVPAQALQRPAALIGAQVQVGNAAWPLMNVAQGRLVFRVQGQFGSVEKSVELTTLSEPALVALLQRFDAANRTTLAPVYLLGLGRAEAARAVEALRSEADDVDALARDAALLAALDRVPALLARQQWASAQDELDQAVATYAEHEFVTVAYAPQIQEWRAKLAAAPRPPMPAPMTAAAATDGYPGIALSLSTAIPAGDPEAQRLAAAANWAASTGNWARHFTALQSAIAAAAGSGPRMQHAQNLERLLALATPALAVEQTRFIRAVGPATLQEFANTDENREFLRWLLVRPAVLAAFNATIEPQDKPADALGHWRGIWSADEPNRDKYAALAIACALVFDEPIRINPDVFGVNSEARSTREDGADSGSREASSLSRYRFFRDSAQKGSLKTSLAGMTPWELVWVVDAPVPDSELTWAQQHANFSRREWGKAYGHIRYRMDRATQGVNPYKAYTLAEIEKEGGICGDQAYFAAITAKANGIPAMVIGGEGDRGGHAWFGYSIARNDWNLNTGRYADNYAAGSTRHPQTGRNVKEHELRQLTDPARRTADFAKSERLVALAALLQDAGQRDLATLGYDAALRAAPKNYAAWNAKLDTLTAAKAPSDEWLRESARMRTTFREFSDLVQEIDKREAAYVATNLDSDAARKLVHRQTARMERKDGERTDLILDSVFREAELAEKGGNAEAIGRIYRDALRDKGGEVVAFKKIAGRYYDWAKTNGKGPDTTRELIAFFDRKHDEPGGDVFAIGAYRGVLRTLSGMAKEQALEPLQRRIERREEKLKELEEKLGKAASRGADR